MGKEGKLFFVVLVVTLLGALTWTVLCPHNTEPAYEGKPLSFWLTQLVEPTNTDGRSEAESAVRQIGTNAIPTLLLMLRRHDSPLKTKMLTWVSKHSFGKFHYTNPSVVNNLGFQGFLALNRRCGTNAFCGLIKILERNSAPESRCQAADVLGMLEFSEGGAKEAFPALVRAAASSNEHVRSSAIWAISMFHGEPDAVDPVLLFPVLVKALRDPSREVRMSSLYGLGYFRGAAKPAVPALVELLHNPDIDSDLPLGTNGRQQDLRSDVENVLRQIDPQTYARVVANQPLLFSPSK